VLECLQSCVEQDYHNLEVIVVDNASTDGTAAAIRSILPSVKLIRTHENIGFFPALNIALANASGEHVFTIDDDARMLEPDGIRRMREAFTRWPNLGAVTCNIEGPFEEPAALKDRYVHTFKTGFTMVPRAVFTDWVGYYPDRFFRSGGERYIATALASKKHPVLQLASVRMHHARTGQGRSSWDWAFYGHRSQILVCLMRDPWYVVPCRLAGKFIKGLVHSLRKGSVTPWAAAWCNVWLQLPYAWKYRHAMSWAAYRDLMRLQRNPRAPL
jgi:GT2 family glycosyltransferase